MNLFVRLIGVMVMHRKKVSAQRPTGLRLGLTWVFFIFLGWFLVHSAYVALHIRKLKAQECYTQAMLDQQRDSQIACLYAYDDGKSAAEVWNPRGRSGFALHHDQPCAENVYCTIKAVHFQNDNLLTRIKDVANFFTPNRFVGYICAGESIRPAHLQPGHDPINNPSDPLCSAVQPTATPTPTRTPTPTLTPIPSPTLTPKPTPTPTPLATPTLLPSVTPTLSGQLGDINLDGRVNLFDFSQMVANMGSQNTCGHRLDLNADCQIDMKDMQLLQALYNKL